MNSASVKQTLIILSLISWISVATSVDNIIRIRKHTTRLQRSDPELWKSTFPQLVSSNPSSLSNNIVYLLTKALADRNQEFKLLNTSKIKSADASLDVTNKADGNKINSIVNLTIVFTASQDIIAPGEAKNQHQPTSSLHSSNKENDVNSLNSADPKPIPVPHQIAELDSLYITNFELQILEMHNMYRKKHGVPTLTYSKKVAKISQEWANHLARYDILQHRPNNKYGENLFMSGSSDPNYKPKAKQATDAWYNEIKFYNFDRELNVRDISKVGHFTQMIWKGSGTLGVGIAQSLSTRNFYVVCNYNSPGNILGQFRKNVLRAK